mmetsp:Transcript_16984/g.35254  ORF Transcript_16984/g.35254 Transcript_16984/m.35254 type:complete len:85 (+) Transcript_16984:2191-2445(+)
MEGHAIESEDTLASVVFDHAAVVRHSNDIPTFLLCSESFEHVSASLLGSLPQNNNETKGPPYVEDRNTVVSQWPMTISVCPFAN